MGDIADIVGGGTPSTGNQSYWDGDIDWYAPAEIADQIYANSSQKKITGLGYENSSAKMLPPGTVLFTSRAGIGKTAILTRKGCTNQGFQSIVPHRGELDSYFIFSRTEELKRYGELVGAGSTFVEVSGKQMAVMELMMPPTMREQQTIGGFFQQLDHLITLHQCKCQIDGCRFQSPLAITWEQRKFSDLVQIERGGSPRPIDDFITDSPDGLNWVKIGDAPAQGNYITKTAEKIKPEGLSKTREVHPGDLILSNSMSFGKPYIMGIDGCIHDGWLLIRNTYKAFDLTFLCHLLGTPQMIIQYKSLAAGSTVNNLNKELVGNTVVTIPTIKEQRVLGQYLETLDNLITLHQREFAFLCKEKSKKFRYIKNAWEQRKVTEIGKIYIGLVTTMTKHYTDEGTLLIRNSDIKDGKFEFGDNPIYLEKTFAEKNETRMHQIGDVITVHTGDVGTSAVITENEAKSIGFATIVTRPNPKIIDSNYLCSFLNTDKHKKWAVSISTGDGRTNYNLGDYFELVVPVPSIAEQKKIASYIQKLNRLITLHQRKPVVVNSSSTMNALPNQHLYFQVLE